MAATSTDTLDPYRLPGGVRPVRYDVTLRPSLDDSSFTGRIEIAVDVDSGTSALVLNAAELKIGRCAVDGTDAPWELDAATERLIIRPGDTIDPGPHRVSIDFVGVLNDKLRGFYRSTYVGDDGREHVIATTQMQATDCRRAFPCWDEPEFKAVFGITLEVDEGLTAISNGREIERSTGAGRTSIRFADTMVMSSYLVAFVVGRLESTATVDVEGIPLRVVHVPGKGHLTDFALDVGAFSLRWFQDYYGIAYPSDKVDLVALPDFAAGAMENLGCITFRENLLLIDPATSTQTELQNVADVVAHELAHMWFGDLVTMRWWNGIWLNEAFATFMEIAACEAYRPDWERWTSFGTERSAAFDVDSLRNTRTVEFEVRSPADADAMFDVLTYQKGGSLLRMLEQYLGTERFRGGVNHYLRTHAYANTETGDLWDAIETTSGEPVRAIMDPWIWQPGYPIVRASLIESDGRPALRIEQHRFLFDADTTTPTTTGTTTGTSARVDGVADHDTTIWPVPIHIRNGSTTTTVLLDTADRLIELAEPNATVVVNAGGSGYFRVGYDDALRARLSPDALADLTTLERYNLVDDAWSATVAGELHPADLLDFLEGFRAERDHAVWQAIVIALRGLGRLLDDGPGRQAFQRRVRDLARPTLTAVGEPGGDESDLTAKLRGLLVGALGVLGDDAGVQAQCREWYDAAASDPAAVDAELTAAATSVVAATGDADTYERMRTGFVEGTTPQAQLRHLYALAEFDDESLLLQTCEFAMTTAVKTQNAPFVLRAAIANRRHGPAAWAYVSEHWDQAKDRFPANTIIRMVDAVKFLDTADLVADAAAFFAEHPVADQRLGQILERQRINTELRERSGRSFDERLVAAER